MKKNMKTIVGIYIGLIIGISTTVGAATIFNSKDITYSSDKTDKTNVKDSLDELYSKTENSGKCPEGYKCIELKPISTVKVGDYISMTPTATSYTISKDLTGYTSDQTINPSELNLWRVIKKNDDGTVDVVSEYISSTNVYFFGKTGYLNFVGALNTIAAQYTDGVHVVSTRHMGYSNQIEKCITLSTTACPSDEGYTIDTNLIQSAIGTLKGTTSSGSFASYWIASRVIYSDGRYFCKVEYNTLGITPYQPFLINGNGTEGGYDYAVRPIITIKSTAGILSGDGTSNSPYKLD